MRMRFLWHASIMHALLLLSIEANLTLSCIQFLTRKALRRRTQSICEEKLSLMVTMSSTIHHSAIKSQESGSSEEIAHHTFECT